VTASLVNQYMHEKTGLLADGLPQLLLDSGFCDIQIVERKIPVGDTEIGVSMSLKDNWNER
jgi:hypothetical protein